MKKKKIVAIIGCGTIATSQHLPAYMAASDVCECKYFVDLIPERAEKFVKIYGGGTALTDYHDILNDPELDCVSVCTPNGAHAPIAIDFLNAGKDVLCEKPASVTYEKAAEMKKAADDNDRILNIGVCNRFKADVNRVKELIDEGKLGKVYHVYCSFRAYRSIPGMGGQFTTKAISGGGVLIDWGVHFLDLILYCIGNKKVTSVSANCYQELGKNMKDYVFTSMWASLPDYNGTCDVEEFCTGFVRTEGPSITFNGAWAQNIDDPDGMYIEFLGDKGGIRLNYYGGFTFYSTDGTMLTKTTPSYTLNDMYKDEIRDFLRCSDEHVKNRASIDEAIKTSQLMQLIYDSAEKGAEIRL